MGNMRLVTAAPEAHAKDVFGLAMIELANLIGDCEASLHEKTTMLVKLNEAYGLHHNHVMTILDQIKNVATDTPDSADTTDTPDTPDTGADTHTT